MVTSCNQLQESQKAVSPLRISNSIICQIPTQPPNLKLQNNFRTQWSQNDTQQFKQQMGQLLKIPFPQKPGRFILLGLKGSGKSTLLTLLRMGKIQEDQVMLNFKLKKVLTDHISLQCWNVDEFNMNKRILLHMYILTCGVVFFVDLTSKTRVEESVTELSQLQKQKLLKTNPWLIVLAKGGPNSVCPREAQELVQQSMEIEEFQFVEFHLNSEYCLFEITEWMKKQIKKRDNERYKI